MHGCVNTVLPISGDDPSVRVLPPAMLEYAKYLQKSYNRAAFPMVNKWPHPPCQKVIKLAAVETKGEQVTREAFDPKKFSRFDSVNDYVQGNNVSLFSLTDLLETKNESTLSLVIVQGAPGIGKSTFAWKFCQEWAEGRLYQKYDLIVLLQTRERYVREAKELKDLFKHLNKKLSVNVADDVISRNGENVLFFFEGLDELPSHYFSKESLLLEIFRGALPQLTIVVTSRPWAAQQLVDLTNNQVTRRVDIIGFLKEDIYDYVVHSFGKGKDLKEFMQYFRTHPQLEMIMYSPLNCAFVVQIYKDFKQSQTKEDFPHTLTQLYTALVHRFVLQFMRNMPEFAFTKFVNLEKLPDPVNFFFYHLCCTAFMSFTRVSVQVAFSDADVGNVETLGLMQSRPDTSFNSENTQTHCFLHFTIQEFLAAFHLSRQSPEQQECFFQIHQGDPKFSVLLTFLIGLNCSIVKHLNRPSPSSELEPHLLHWLFESQSPEDVAAFLGKEVVFFQTYSKLAPIDIYSLTYCLRQSNCTWNLIVDLDDLTTVYEPTSTAAFTGHIDELSIFNANATAIQKFFFSLPRRLFEKIRFLYFYNREDINIGFEYYEILTSLFKEGLLQNLVEFQFNYAPSLSGIGGVIGALHECCSRLETLKIERCLFTESDILPLCKSICSPHSRLSRLALISITFEENILNFLNSALPHARALKRLDLSFNQLELSDIEILALATESSTIQALRLRSCSIGPDGAELLADCLEKNSSIMFLSLAQNQIGFSGASALAEMLKVNTTLQDIRLNEDKSITTSGAGLLIDVLLKHNKIVEHIEIAESCEPVEYGSALMTKTSRIKFM